jgi:hypothetical protein
LIKASYIQLLFLKGDTMASFREQGPTDRLEKRKLFRFPVQLPVKIGHKEDLSSICTNLSTDGASIETSQPLNVSEKLAVSVMIAPKEEPLRMVGKVVWKRETEAVDTESRKVQEVGVRFLRPLPRLEKLGGEEPEPVDFMKEEEEPEFILPRRV